MIDDKVLNKIVDFGDKYRGKYLSKNIDKNKVKNDWWNALLFFFDRAYYQGRRDIVSKRVHDAALKVFQELSPNKVDFNNLRQSNWLVLESKLKKVIGKGKIGKYADIRMTVEIFQFIEELDKFQRNISKYSIEKIVNGNVRELYFELQKRIFSVGPKISSFYLRDLISIFNLDDKISEQDLQFVQPIDTWVRQICYRIGLINDLYEDEAAIRNKIVKICSINNLSSLKFNQGAWFLGSNSFDILLKNIERIELKEDGL